MGWRSGQKDKVNFRKCAMFPESGGLTQAPVGCGCAGSNVRWERDSRPRVTKTGRWSGERSIVHILKVQVYPLGGGLAPPQFQGCWTRSRKRHWARWGWQSQKPTSWQESPESAGVPGQGDMRGVLGSGDGRGWRGCGAELRAGQVWQGALGRCEPGALGSWESPHGRAGSFWGRGG